MPAHGQGRHSDCMPCAAHSCQPRIQHWVDSCRRVLARLYFLRIACCAAVLAMATSICATAVQRICRATSRRAPSARNRWPPRTAGSRICGACLHDPPPFCSSLVPFRYAYPLDHLVRGLKFRNELACGRVLGQMFARSVLAARRAHAGSDRSSSACASSLPTAWLQPGERARAGDSTRDRRGGGVRCRDSTARNCRTGRTGSQSATA